MKRVAVWFVVVASLSVTSAAEAQTLSNTCLFLFGPRAWQMQEYPKLLPIRSSCTDGVESIGVVVPRGFTPQGRFTMTRQGNPVCKDLFGNDVPYISSENIPKTGLATMVGREQPVIYIRRSQTSQLPPGAVRLLYAHECGHHALGQIIMAERGHIQVSAREELNADCWGLLQWRRVRNKWSQELEDQAMDVFSTVPDDAVNIPGTERVEYLMYECH